MKRKTAVTVLDNTRLAEDVYSLLVQYDAGMEPEEVRPGQFAGIFPKDGSMLLMRPISICEWRPGIRSLRFVYRTAGRGTHEFARLAAGDRIDLLGILGNGYDISKLEGKSVLLLGGGIGIPPMLGLAETLYGQAQKVTAVMGYRDSDLFLTEDFEPYADLLIATEDGSIGTRGNVLDAVRENNVECDAVCACGPLPMLRAVKHFASDRGVPAYISLEERMACGVGACLGCVTKTVHTDEHSQVRNARVCTEGPVFDAGEVEIG